MKCATLCYATQVVVLLPPDTACAAYRIAHPLLNERLLHETHPPPPHDPIRSGPRFARIAAVVAALMLVTVAAVQTISAGRADFAALGRTTVSDAGASVTIDAAALPGIPAASVEAVELTATRLDRTESPTLPAAEARYEVLPEAVYRLDLSAHLRDDLQPAALGRLAHEASICLARPQTAWNPVLVQYDGRRWQALTPTVSTAERGADVEVCALSREIGVVAVANADRLRTQLEVSESGNFARWTAEYTVRASELLAELPGVSALWLWNGSRWLLYTETAPNLRAVLDFTVMKGDRLWLTGDLEDTTLPAPANLRAFVVADGMLFLNWISDPDAGTYQLSWTSDQGDEGSIEIEAGAHPEKLITGLVNNREYAFSLKAESATAGFGDSETATIVATPRAALAALTATHFSGSDGCAAFVDATLHNGNTVSVQPYETSHADRYYDAATDQCYLTDEAIKRIQNEVCDADCLNRIAASNQGSRGQVGGGSASGGAVGTPAYGDGSQGSPDPIDPVTLAAFQTAFKNAGNPPPHSSNGVSNLPDGTPAPGNQDPPGPTGLVPCSNFGGDPNKFCGNQPWTEGYPGDDEEED